MIIIRQGTNACILVVIVSEMAMDPGNLPFPGLAEVLYIRVHE